MPIRATGLKPVNIMKQLKFQGESLYCSEFRSYNKIRAHDFDFFSCKHST